MECLQDPSASFYSVMKTEGDNLITTSYSVSFELLDIFEEEFGKKGTRLIDFQLYFPDMDEVDKVDNPIISTENYVVQWKPKSPYSFSAQFHQPDYKMNFLVSRDKVRKDRVEYMGGEVKVLGLPTTFDVNVTDSEGKEYFNFQDTRFYAKGIGIVRIERDWPDFNRHLTYVLTRIISASEWEEMIN